MVDGEFKGMLHAGVIWGSMSESGAPVVFVPKKDCTPRFCIDYRRLGLVTEKDSYPLPMIDECIHSLGEAIVLNTVDCNARYWQIPVAEKDIPKIELVYQWGLRAPKDALWNM